MAISGSPKATVSAATISGGLPPSGTITGEFSLPNECSPLDGESYLEDITAGPDGNLWFITGSYCFGSDGSVRFGRIGRITPSGTITGEFRLPTGSVPGKITVGPDGNLWFTESDKIGRITPTGHITEFPLPTPQIPTPQSGLDGITAGPDGNLWFTESDSDNIGRITPTGHITEFLLPTLQSAPQGITAGPDGNLWFIESGRDIIGQITRAGDITEFRLPDPGSLPGDITTGPDGNLWFVGGV